MAFLFLHQVKWRRGWFQVSWEFNAISSFCYWSQVSICVSVMTIFHLILFSCLSAPNMDPPHFCVIVTQEQVKVGSISWSVAGLCCHTDIQYITKLTLVVCPIGTLLVQCLSLKSNLLVNGDCNGCSFVVTHLIWWSEAVNIGWGYTLLACKTLMMMASFNFNRDEQWDDWWPWEAHTFLSHITADPLGHLSHSRWHCLFLVHPCTLLEPGLRC